MLAVVLAGLVGPGIARDIVRALFALFVIAMLIVAINQRAKRFGDEVLRSNDKQSDEGDY